MKHSALLRLGAWSVPFALLSLLLLAAPADAGKVVKASALVDAGPYGPNNRPVFFVVSLTDMFETPFIDRVNGGVMSQADSMGSQVMVIPVGQYVAGETIEDTRYEGMDLSSIDLTNLPEDPATGLPMDPELLNHNQVTVLGSFCTLSGQVHMVTPDPAPIPPAVQLAFFNASPLFDQLPLYPTTVELACFIYENQGPAGADVNDIMHAITQTPMTLSCTTCFTEGDLFPHEPTGKGLFSFHVRFDPQTGDFQLDICLPIEVWIKGQNGTNPFNLDSNGLLPVVVPTTAHFDAVAEVDVDTLQIGTYVVDGAGIEVFVGVPSVKSTVTDQDGDGDLDLVVHFDTQAIVALDGVDEYTTELRFAGTTKLGMCLEGADMIRIVPPTK